MIKVFERKQEGVVTIKIVNYEYWDNQQRFKTPYGEEKSLPPVRRGERMGGIDGGKVRWQKFINKL